ncbi:hypothetical protein MFAL_38520 [Mycolicibacterium fallax]|nr:hypothetical protein MFAL_38520 [Mycolicibacterium fallax]
MDRGGTRVTAAGTGTVRHATDTALGIAARFASKVDLVPDAIGPDPGRTPEDAVRLGPTLNQFSVTYAIDHL